MTKTEKQAIIEMLWNALDRSAKDWDEKVLTHAYIVGYLEGTIKAVIRELE